jgi:predicted porin
MKTLGKSGFIVFILLLLPGYFALGQSAKQTDSVGFYGSMRAQIAAYNKKVEMENNGSRIGFTLHSRAIESFNIEGKLELGVNLIKNNNSFKSDDATSENPSAFLAETVKPITTRLGYIGLHSDRWGTFLIGKQWSVYHDVSGYTDYFNAFGGIASGTYNKGTDGGGEGTGRAESAITYRNNFHNLQFGLQIQLPGESFNYGGSLLYQLPHGLLVGAAFNHYDVPESLQFLVKNSRNSANSLVFLLRYTDSRSSIAVTYANNGSETQYLPDLKIAGFAANGVELHAAYWLTKTIQVMGGFNYLVPTRSFESIPDDFNIFIIPVGFAWNILPDFICYSEFQLNEGRNIISSRESNVYVLGLKYNFQIGRSVL